MGSSQHRTEYKSANDLRRAFRISFKEPEDYKRQYKKEMWLHELRLCRRITVVKPNIDFKTRYNYTNSRTILNSIYVYILPPFPNKI